MPSVRKCLITFAVVSFVLAVVLLVISAILLQALRKVGLGLGAALIIAILLCYRPSGRRVLAAVLLVISDILLQVLRKADLGRGAARYHRHPATGPQEAGVRYSLAVVMLVYRQTVYMAAEMVVRKPRNGLLFS